MQQLIRLALVSFLAASILVPCLPAGAQIAEQAVDLTPGSSATRAASSSPHGFRLVAGGRVIFNAEDFRMFDGAQGSRLWVTEGTATSTRSLPAAGHIVGATDALVYSLERRFSLGDQVSFLWRTDGTLEGTFVIPDVDPGEFAEFVSIGETLVLIDSDGHIHATEGTAETTRQLGATLRVQAPHGLAAVGERIVFLGNPDAGSPLPNRPTLWEIDVASGVGRRLFSDDAPDFSSILNVSGGRVFIAAMDDDGSSLWVADPISGQVTQLLAPGGPIVDEIFAGREGEVLFTGFLASEGSDLWRTDGTVAGTRRLTRLGLSFGFPFPPSSISWARPVGGDVLFIAGSALWRTGAGPGDEVSFTEACSGSSCQVAGTELIPFGDLFAFESTAPTTGRPEIWLTDGTASGTRPLVDLCRGACDDVLPGVATEGESLFFIAHNASRQGQLWRTDGSVAGTRQLTSAPTSLVGIESGELMRAPFGMVTHLRDQEYGDELWLVEPPGEKTGILLDISVSRDSSLLESVELMGDRALFFQNFDVFAYEGVSGAATALTDFGQFYFPRGILVGGEGAYAWVTLSEVILVALGASAADSLQIGTFDRAERATPKSMTHCLGADYFLMRFGEGAGLWKVTGDGTGVERIVGPTDFEHGDFHDLICLGDELLYLAVSSEKTAFYLSDGTLAGTEMAAQVATRGYDETQLSKPVAFNGALHFTLCENFGGISLWKLDGTLERVVAARGVGMFSRCGDPTRELAEPIVFQGQLYYVSGFRDGGVTLRRSDGTVAGTTVVTERAERTLAPGNPELAEAPTGVLFAQVGEETGVEPWIADASGARLLRDVRPGPRSSLPAHLTEAGDLIYFVADDGVHGAELWRTDGTAVGTRLVHDLYPGALGSSPSDLLSADDRLYFIADDGLTGRELWFLPLDGTDPCRAEQETLCLSERYKVEAQWEDFRDRQGRAQARPLTDDTGTFYFFDAANLELMVKTLDGRSNNGHVWTFYGALSNVEYYMTVTDTQTGLTRRYFNPKRNFASVGDTRSFGPLGANAKHAPEPLEATSSSWIEVSRYQVEPETLGLGEGGSCAAEPGRLCLQGGRFAVDGLWTDFRGGSGEAAAIPLTDDTGAFWFFRDTNVELLVKVLDGRANNGNFWVFLGSLSNVNFDVRVVDTLTGNVRIYQNRGRRFASFGDTEAFPGS